MTFQTCMNPGPNTRTCTWVTEYSHRLSLCLKLRSASAPPPSGPRPPFCIAVLRRFKLKIRKFSCASGANMQKLQYFAGGAQKTRYFFSFCCFVPENCEIWASFQSFCFIFALFACAIFSFLCEKKIDQSSAPPPWPISGSAPELALKI